MTIDLANPVVKGRTVSDQRGRVFRDLRISLTDRCNFRCTYCMPREKFGSEHAYLGRSQLLTDDEVVRLAHRFVGLGARKIRLTGGEPLLRAGIVELVSRLADLEVDLAVTTNGSLLPRLAAPLARAGCKRVTVSLDSLDDAVFATMSDTRFGVGDVLAGISAAEEAGLAPVKINTVVQRGVNDGPGLRHLVDLAGHFRGTGHVVRFIEYMDVGGTNGWSPDDVVPSAAVAAALDARYPIEPLDPAQPGEVASRYRYRDGAGEVGFISSVSEPFCGECSRGRLSADGQLFTCLFAGAGTDLRSPLRAGASDEELDDVIAGRWRQRSDRYSELRSRDAPTPGGPRVEMSFIGG